MNITDTSISDLELFKTNNGWEIDFLYNDDVYRQTVSMFDLKERYNAEKCYFGKYLQTKRIFNIKELAESSKCTEDEILEVLFCYERNKQEHTPKEKCRLELLEQV